MKPTLNEKFIAYLALLSGLSISAVAVYYSVVGLTAIFAAAVIPIIIMGTTLEISKLVATVWLKQNWKTAPLLIKTYLATAIVVLMVITSMGIFGFLSKAHSDQNLVSGDVLSRIAVYDEKIKTGKENIDANRKALKQLDEAVDQVMARSDSEKGADKAVAIRKAQSKERTRLQSEITSEQEKIAQLNEERAPIAAEVRKVEAEVGPIKYIAAFFYGSTDETILEKAVTWVIITLIVVFDPLAVILLLASQMSFQEFREREGRKEKGGVIIDKDGTIIGLRAAPKQEPVVEEVAEGDTTDVIDTEPLTITEHEEPIEDIREDGYQTLLPEYEEDDGALTDEQIEEIRRVAKTYIDETPKNIVSTILPDPVIEAEGYIQNEEQKESNVWTTTITQAEYAETAEQRNRDTLINQWVENVRNKKISLHHVPIDLINKVKERL